MVLYGTGVPDQHLESCRSLLAAFFPGRKISMAAAKPERGDRLLLVYENHIEEERVTATLFCGGLFWVYELEPALCRHLRSFPVVGKESFQQLLLKRAVLSLLKEATGQKALWGTLIGVRPGKLVDRLVQAGLSASEQEDLLRQVYGVSGNKIRLLQGIYRRQEPYRRSWRQAKGKLALYLSIPFCPSRCNYCSFPGYSLSTKNRSLYDEYQEILLEEVALAGRKMAARALTVDSIYIGGGTPAVLAAGEIERLLAAIVQWIPAAGEVEFTFEGGRPDVLTPEKLNILAAYGVNRLSINPQTMQEETLRRIGREHNSAQIREVYQQARNSCSWKINMDLILGLPGETVSQALDSLAQVIALRPENVTVHGLAFKRGAALTPALGYGKNAGAGIWTDAQSAADKMLAEAGYSPYYLYRQKNVTDKLENVGYALPGGECRYNIAVIEEALTVWGIGAGAASKIFGADGRHENIYEPVELLLFCRGKKEAKYMLTCKQI